MSLIKVEMRAEATTACRYFMPLRPPATKTDAED
jgi:hypothetical protein